MDAVNVRDVGKVYRVGVGRARLREMTPPPFDTVLRRVFPKFWAKGTFNALDGVSVSIEHGESVGLVGHNGAGKTTLLKVIAGVTAPSQGTVRVNGRIGALIDALVGFHPELTGRENIYLLSSAHGMSKKETQQKVEDVFAFAEIDDLADTPVKRYSAGMMSRLGFATIVALRPEVMLVDEVLSVGDAAFQRKCMHWMDDYRSSGGTLLFVSHNLALLRNMTERVVWINQGRLVQDGSTSEVLAAYAESLERRETGAGWEPSNRRKLAQAMAERGMNRWGAGGARLERVHFDRMDGGLDVSISYDNEDLQEGLFCIGFVDETDHNVGAAASQRINLSDTSNTVRCSINPLPLEPGIYFPVVAILSSDGIVRDRWRLDKAIVVEQNGTPMLDGFGAVRIEGEWSQG